MNTSIMLRNTVFHYNSKFVRSIIPPFDNKVRQFIVTFYGNTSVGDVRIFVFLSIHTAKAKI